MQKKIHEIFCRGFMVSFNQPILKFLQNTKVPQEGTLWPSFFQYYISLIFTLKLAATQLGHRTMP